MRTNEMMTKIHENIHFYEMSKVKLTKEAETTEKWRRISQNL